MTTIAYSTFEAGIEVWKPNGGTTIERSTGRWHSGTASLKVNLATGSSLQGTQRPITGLIVGVKYTASAWVYVPADTLPSAIGLGVPGTGSTSGVASTADTWQRLQLTWTATSTEHNLGVVAWRATTAGMVFFLDDFEVTAVAAVAEEPRGSLTWDDPAERPLQVTVYDRTYRRVGRIGDYVSASVTHQHLGVGTGTIVVDEDAGGVPAAQLLLARTEVVPVVVDDGVRLWTGRVQHNELSGEPGVGEIAATLTSDFAHLRAILAWQVPGAPLSGQNAKEYDTRTGPLITVAKAYLTANIARLAGHRYAVVPPPAVGQDTSPTVTLKARMTRMDELLVPPCREHGYQLTAQLWLPGWPQPPGLALTQPTIVFDVLPVHDAQRVLWTDAVGIVDRDVELEHPTATTAIVGMKGEGVDRQYTTVQANDGRVSTLGPFAFREHLVNATDVDTPAEGQTRGREKLAEETSGTVSAGITVQDGVPFRYGRDYWCGSRVRTRTGGTELTDTVERITVTQNRDGRTVTPQVGQSDPAETPEQAVIRLVAALRSQIAALTN